eukprot:1633738-Lingulodinium_polyedra.AAC.1
MTFPGLVGKMADLRLPLCVINKKFLAKSATVDAMLGILRWSFVRLSIGVMPVAMHDGADWQTGRGSKRAKQ